MSVPRTTTSRTSGMHRLVVMGPSRRLRSYATWALAVGRVPR
jgi:hypothetical protein